MTEQLSLVLKQCASPKFTALTKAIHSKSLKLGKLSCLHFRTNILTAYSKCGIIYDACQLFDEIADQRLCFFDTVSWNSVISGCVQNGKDAEAFRYFKNMQSYYSNCSHGNDFQDLGPDSFTLSSIISSSYCLEMNIIHGEQLHGYALKTAILSSISVGNSLITLYAKWGRLHESRLVFESMPELNVVSWTALISGHAQQQGNEEETLRMFVLMMRNKNQRPNQFTFASIFSSCGKLASLSQGMLFISVALKMGHFSNIHVQNSLVGFCSDCGYLEEAKAIFKHITNPDIVSWNSLLKGYSQQGRGEEALSVFEEMCKRCETPDAITFLSVLSACRHTGMVFQGLKLFKTMKEDHGIEPEVEHISCIVDLLGRAGQLHQAEEFIRGFQFKVSSSAWRTLLGACRVHGNAELAKLAASRLLELEPCDAEAQIVVSHIYAANGRWDMVANLRCSIKEKGVRKEPGFSWIEVGNRVHSFVVADWGHSQIEEIQKTLMELTNHIKDWIVD
ncbi:hypothetical protein HHK36_030432 [Tetracentron sinense]|uniref:Pentatricopeptide repeat-containing protein n=1 Tax=Tetracentron sinense TaxID=13715 RepID=A0A834Y9K8_TETSI|nr:hypothetical protein HHK36_030432 [Tetracentron sinense]